MIVLAEEFALIITSFLFLGLAAFSFPPRVELALRSRATFAIGVALFLGTAALLVGIENVQHSSWWWVVPVLATLAMAVREHLVGLKASGGSETIGPRSSSEIAAVDVKPGPSQARLTAHVAAACSLRARAANPTTSPQELVSLAYSNPALRATIAVNPATPATLLEWLADVGDPAVQAAIGARELQPHPIPQSV